MANIKITLTRSTIGCQPRHKLCARALGLTRIRQTVERQDTPEIRGLVQKISHLVRVEACN